MTTTVPTEQEPADPLTPAQLDRLNQIDAYLAKALNHIEPNPDVARTSIVLAQRQLAMLRDGAVPAWDAWDSTL